MAYIQAENLPNVQKMRFWQKPPGANVLKEVFNLKELEKKKNDTNNIVLAIKVVKFATQWLYCLSFSCNFNGYFKDDFQSVLCTLESCLRFLFCFMHDVTTSKLLT